MMKEKVDLNNNGLSIESTARILHRGKWVKRHILCKKHQDLNHPILFVYKNQKDKQKNVYKYSLVLSHYIGYESGLEYKKRRNTMSIITAEVCLMLSFDMAESLVVWEAWIKNICGQTISFFMQLKKIPPSWKCTHALLKEVQCHVKEGQLGIVYNRPQEVIMIVDLRRDRVLVDDNNLVTVHFEQEKPEDTVVLLCPKSPHFKRCLGAAKLEGVLPKLLNREQFEGEWMPREEKKRSFGDHTSQFTVNMSDLASLMRTPEPHLNYRIGQPSKLIKGLSKSGYFPSNYYQSAGCDYENLPHRPISRANSTAAYYSTIAPNVSMNNASSVNYVNIEPGYYGNGRKISANAREVLSTKVSVPSTRSINEGPIYCNIGYDPRYYNADDEPTYEEIPAGGVGRSFSMPDYVNVQITDGVPHILDHTDPDSLYENHEVIRRRSDNSVHSHNVYPSTSRAMTSNKGRSNPDFKASPPTEKEKHENWKRAKKFFSAFKPKSQTDLLQRKQKGKEPNIVKSSSTGALQFANSVHMFSRSSTSSETEDIRPALNMNCHQMTRSVPHLSGLTQPPQGLVQAPNDIVLSKSRSGVGAILARRKIRGSFTKYDGERATHMYPGKENSGKEDSIQEEDEPKEPEKEKKIKPPPPRPPKTGKLVDGIASAVNRGQEKLKMSDRRASNVSFHKININAEMPDGTVLSEKEGSSRPMSRADSLSESRKLNTLAVLASSRNSNSHSDYTRNSSSNESISSDARSRISIRKHRASPPRVSAPKLDSETSLHEIQPHVIRLIPTSSLESCNSEQTARSFSLRSNNTKKTRNGHNSEHSLHSAASHKTVHDNYCELVLPVNPPQTSSSSTSVSSRHSNSAYIMIDPISTQAVHLTNLQQHPFERSRVKSSSMTRVSVERRKSHGHGSSTSETMSVDHQPKQGFFKKYRKVRRNRKAQAGSSSMTQLNF